MTGVVTVTLAAAIDLTYHLDRLESGHVNRAHHATRELSGKGVNISHALVAAGNRTRGVIAVGDQDVSMLSHAQHAEIFAVTPTAGHTRVNTTILDRHGHTTKVNDVPVPLRRCEWEAARDRVLDEALRIDADWVVLAGAIPSLAGGDELVPVGELFTAARDRGLRVAVDSSGFALVEVVTNHATEVTLIKPNTQELCHAVGKPAATIGEVIAAAGELRERGVDWVYVSMGADGALLVSDDGVWHAHAQPRRVVNSTGAGDASLAGFLAEIGDGHADAQARALAQAASWGAHSVSQATTLLHEPSLAPAAQVTVGPSPETPLVEPVAIHREERRRS